MIGSPFRYEEDLTSEDFGKIGQLLLRCSHIDHILGNCLKVLLRLSDEEAVVMVFPLGINERFHRIKQVANLSNINDDAKAALDGLSATLTFVQMARNDLAHGIIDETKDEPAFHRRSHARTISKADAFSAEELINYAAHAALALRYAVGLKDEANARHPLPDRPALPEHLQS